MGKGKVDSKEVRSVRLLFIEGEMMHVMKAEKEEVGVHHALCDRQGEDLQTEVKHLGSGSTQRTREQMLQGEYYSSGGLFP